MATYNYELGLAVGTRTNVESLVLTPPSPDSEMPAYPVFYTGGDGDESADGFPQCIWTFDYLTYAEYDVLEDYIAGQCSTVHIRTRNRDGTYACYQAFMHKPKFPREGTRVFKGFRNVQFRFTHMIVEACS